MEPIVTSLVAVAACVAACWVVVAAVLAVRGGDPVGEEAAFEADDRDPCGPGLLHVATGPRLSRDVPTLPVNSMPASPINFGELYPHPNAGTPLFYTQEG